jgi:hypothetical protein
VHPYLAEAFATGRIAEFRREADAVRLATDLPRGGRPRRRRPWTSLGTRMAAWAERPRAGRTLGVCCPV